MKNYYIKHHKIFLENFAKMTNKLGNLRYENNIEISKTSIEIKIQVLKFTLQKEHEKFLEN